VYTALSSGRSGFFTVTVRAIYLRDGAGGESAKSADPTANIVNLGLSEGIVNRGGVIVDSGTTDTNWNSGISSAFRAAFKDMAGIDYTHETMALTVDDLAGLPTILIQIAGDEEMNIAVTSDPNEVAGLAGDLDPEHPYDVILALPPSHYMELDEKGTYTARFYDDEGGGSVLGGNAIMGHDVLFDVDNSRIGWAESDCDYNKLVTENGYTDVLEVSAVEETKEAEDEENETDEGAPEEEEEEAAEEEEEEEQAEEEEEEDNL
jgi:hypothetical protein